MFFCKKDKKNLQHVKKQVQDNVLASKEQLSPVLSEAVNKVDQLKEDVKEITDGQVEQLSKHVQSKPIKAVLISTVVGFILGRITR